jgi:transcriptional activator of cad operon
MRLLVCLAERRGEIVSIDDLLSQVWPEVTVTPDSVYQAVATLRRLLGDHPKQPAYIATVPRLGYRMVAAVRPWADEAIRDHASSANGAVADLAPAARGRRGRMRWVWAAVAAVCVAAVATFWIRGEMASNNRLVISGPASTAEKPAGAATSIGSIVSIGSVGSIGSIESIAVLPFPDLSEGMRNEEFADGMTEELIDKLSKIPGLRVPAPTASFFYKGKQVPVADIAKALGVTYVLDGSVRKAGSRVRVAARLVRADNGYVIWTESYDRPFGDMLMVQDDIAGEVTKALRASIKGTPGNGAAH